MFGLGYLLWIGFAVFVSYRIVIRGKAESGTRNLVCAALAAVLIALPFWDVILGALTFNRICRNEGGLVRHGQVDLPLSSVSIAKHAATECYGCLVLLRMGATTETQAEFHDPPGPYALADRTGAMRYRLAELSDPACVRLTTAFPSVYDIRQSPGTLNDGQTCIVGEHIREISADYELTGATVAVERRGIVTLRVRTVDLRRRNIDQPLATLTRLEQEAWIGDKVGLPPVRSCPAFLDRISNTFSPITLAEKLTEK